MRPTTKIPLSDTPAVNTFAIVADIDLEQKRSDKEKNIGRAKA